MSSRGGREGAKINTELFTLTYGSLVAQLIKDYEEDAEVNKQLERMGYNIGLRLIDDFLANSGVGKCQDFKETADVVAKIGFRMFLGITPTVSNWTEDGNECSIILEVSLVQPIIRDMSFYLHMSPAPVIFERSNVYDVCASCNEIDCNLDWLLQG